MDISSLTPMSCEKVQEMLDGAIQKMKRYCIKETIKTINSRYIDYANGSFWFSKKKSLIEWCNQKVVDCGYLIERYKALRYWWIYDGFITSTLANSKLSSNGMMYLSSEDMQTLRGVYYRTHDKDVLNEIDQIEESNKELWDLIDNNWKLY